MGFAADDSQSIMKNRKDLQAMSKQRVAAWPNTIEALRKKKEDDRLALLEKEEVSYHFFSPSIIKIKIVQYIYNIHMGLAN